MIYSSKNHEVDIYIIDDKLEVDTLIGLSTGKLLSLENKQNIKIYDIKEKTHEIIQTLQFEHQINCYLFLSW